jgi:hypothetical protein
VALPPRFLGTWERVELEVDGEAVADPGRAVWLEAGSGYVDVRTGRAPDCPAGSAGTTSWDGASLAWGHDVDSRSGDGLYASVERGRITFAGDDLVEEGTGADGSPAPVPRPLAAPARRRRAVGTQPGGRDRPGPRRADRDARRRGGRPRDGGRWRGGRLLPLGRPGVAGRADPGHPGDLPLLEPGAVLPDGWRWRPAPFLP